MTAGTRVIGYVRVSTVEQGRSGLGLEAQRMAIRAECERRGWVLVKIEEDVASGKSTRGRDGLERAQEACRKRRASAMVVARLDRLARSVEDFARLSRETPLVILDPDLDMTTPMGEAMANVIATFAQLERRLIGQRISEALQAKMAQGWRPPAAKVISGSARRRICTLHRRGLSERAIVAKLTAEGVPAVGTAWHRNTVRRVLAQEATST